MGMHSVKSDQCASNTFEKVHHTHTNYTHHTKNEHTQM